MILELVQNIALLLALSLLHGLCVRALARQPRLAKWAGGLIFGAVCIVGMMIPIHLAPGVIVDGRSVLLSMAGLFGGPVTALIAGSLAGIYRLSLGGDGLLIGIATILIAVALGLVYRAAWKRGRLRRTPSQLFIFGLSLHALSIVMIGLVPGQSIAHVYGALGLPYLLITGAATALLGLLLHDLERRLQNERALLEREARLRAIAGAVPDILFVLDEDGRYQEVMTHHEELLYRDAKNVIGRQVHEVLPEPIGRQLQEAIHQALRSGTPVTIQYALKIPKGLRHFEGRIQAIEGDEHPRTVVLIVQDVTLSKASEEEIHALAYYDHLTRLPNRRLLTDRLRQALAHSRRSGSRGALMFIDLDDFKNINDLRGHHAGDELLEQAAARLSAAVRESDTVARFGGDEFVVLIEQLGSDDVAAAAAADHLAEKLLETIGRPYAVGNQQHTCTASIGIAMFGDREQTVDELMQNADLSMYESKRQGKNRTRFFDPAMQQGISERLTLDADLREALENDEFELHYQAQCDARGRIDGVEALARWRHPTRGLLPPGLFIPAAERCGLMPLLGRKVLEIAASQLGRWAYDARFSTLRLSVNVSATQLYSPNFVVDTCALLERTGCPPDKLVLELTESVLVGDMEGAIQTMEALRRIGIRFSIDDFGTGYSSLAYLQRLPLDEVKIDRSFVRDLPDSASSQAIVRTIVALARTLGLRLIAEGVEQAPQLATLIDEGCTSFQGFLFYRPVSIDAIEAQLTRMRDDVPQTPVNEHA